MPFGYRENKSDERGGVMGMVLIPLYIFYVVALLGVVALIDSYITKSRKVKIIIIVIGLLIPTYDIIVTNVIGAYYCLSAPHPKTYIKQKVEYPQSIYWEDNVYPGFSKEDRKLMIINYLDGKYLKTMALNGDDGKVYVYQLNKPIWTEIKKEFDVKKYKNIYDQYAQTIINRSQELYTKETMPKMNYTVTFNEVKLNPFSRKFLYSDETKVIDNNTSEVIAYNRRYMHFFYNIAPDFAMGNRYYQQDSVCGYKYPNFDEMFNYKRVIYGGGLKHINGLSQKLYKRYIKGEK